ncbi:MAG: transcription termination factor NusA [Gammaproteobacteria bacterium]
MSKKTAPAAPALGKQILAMVDSLANEKAVSKEDVFRAVEAGLAMATKKLHHPADIAVRVEISRRTGEYDTFRYWTVVDDSVETGENPDAEMRLTDARQRKATINVGETIEEPIDSIEFGRIAAQTAKNVIFQEVRKAERNKIVENYKDRLHQLVSGIVKKVTREAILLDLGDAAEAIISRDEMIPREAVRVGDRIRGYLYDVHFEARGPQLFVSRIRPEMLIELFKIEVPEIGEEIIQIKAAARDPGSRAKIAVKTNDGRIDPIGACVGMRGARVQAVSSELNGERVDIVLWDDNVAQFVINAMAPAEVVSIIMDEDAHAMDIAVREDQLSQAIGRNGQNVRLASQLTGWTINVMSESQAAEKTAAEAQDIRDIFIDKLGVDEDIADILIREGFSTLEEIAYVPLNEMQSIEEFDQEIIDALRARAKDFLLTQAIANEELDASHEPADDLLNMEGMTRELAVLLTKHNIVTMEDLAEQAVDDILEIQEIADELDRQQASQLIMKAREPWFK